MGWRVQVLAAAGGQSMQAQVGGKLGIVHVLQVGNEWAANATKWAVSGQRVGRRTVGCVGWAAVGLGGPFTCRPPSCRQ